MLTALRCTLLASLAALAMTAGPAYADLGSDAGPQKGEESHHVIPMPDEKPYGTPGPVTVGGVTFDVSPMLAPELERALAQDAQSAFLDEGCTWAQAIASARRTDWYYTRYWWPQVFWYMVTVNYQTGLC